MANCRERPSAPDGRAPRLSKIRNSFAGATFRGWRRKCMLSDHYVHPEFGYLSPTRRWRRELRIAFFSGLFGIGIGAAAVIALSHNNNTDEARVSRGLNSAPVLRGEPTEAGSSYNSPQAASIEIELNKDHTGKPDGSTADAK